MTRTHCTRLLSATIVMLACLPVAAVGAAAPKPIHEIVSVGEGSPPIVPESVQIVAKGRASTTGWTDPKLEATVETPEGPGGPTRSDTLTDYVFEATPPTGGGTVMTGIQASTIVSKGHAKGVRIWSATNCVEYRWGEQQATTALSLDVCKAHRDQ